jgi:hypothetical protein
MAPASPRRAPATATTRGRPAAATGRFSRRAEHRKLHRLLPARALRTLNHLPARHHDLLMPRPAVLT